MSLDRSHANIHAEDAFMQNEDEVYRKQTLSSDIPTHPTHPTHNPATLKLHRLTISQKKGEKGGGGKEEKGGGCLGRMGRWLERVVLNQQGTWGVLAECGTGRTVWEKVDQRGRRLKLVLVVEESALGEEQAQGLYDDLFLACV